MNYEVFCFELDDENGLFISQKEYFSTFEEALQFEKSAQTIYYSISITPMNAEAEELMTR
jgi:hypothetical protein